MSTTELVTPKSRSGKDHNGNGLEQHWSDQVVLSGAGLLSEGIERTRANAEALINVVDAVILGTLDLVDEWSSLSAQLLPQLVPMVTTKPAQFARQAYTTATKAVRESVNTA